MGVMQLSPHFSLEELTFSSTAVRLGIDNTPPPEIVANLTQACSLFEQVRALLGVPMHTDSGYRCPALNAAVGGVPTSAHTLGWALDFTAPLFGTPLDIVRKIVASQMATQMKWDQLIQEGTWVHISAAPTMRQQVLTATLAAVYRVRKRGGVIPAGHRALDRRSGARAHTAQSNQAAPLLSAVRVRYDSALGFLRTRLLLR